MKQSLNLHQSLQLKITPQLQQALKLLQMSTLDLQQEIQQALDSNIMLEVYEEDNAIIKQDKKIDQIDSITSEGSQTDIPDELPIDSSWEDVYESVLSSESNLAEAIEFESQNSKATTLQDYLLWQEELIPFSDKDHAIAIAIIDSINEDGYLLNTPDEIFQGLSEQLESLYPDEVNAVLHRIQHFDPSGVGAIDLKECLKLQLEQMPETTPYRENAIIVVSQYLELLATQEKMKLMRCLNISERQLDNVVALIRTLNPKPGTQIQDSGSQYVIPDVYVRKLDNKWQVGLNPDIAPKLRINPYYSSLIKRSNNSSDNSCMKNHLIEAKWFIKNLHNRNDTLLLVARSIVEKQTEFLEHGSIAMRPMVLKDIAEELELHESTISRVTTHKYMHTPNGIVEFKYFFSSHVSTSAGGECSSTAIRAFIKELISNENLAKPLSDDKIANLLIEKGINIARRTITKYRESMLIPSSSQRKRIL